MSPPSCDIEIFERGTVILSFHGPKSSMIEDWVKGIATKTKTRTDWHFYAGRAIVVVLGDADEIARVRDEIDRTWSELLTRHLASAPESWTVCKEVEGNLARMDLEVRR